jgi:fumarate hydratase class II
MPSTGPRPSVPSTTSRSPARRCRLPFIHAIARIKLAAARVNRDLGLLDGDGPRPSSAPQAVIDGHHDDQFPVDVFQTGSGTSSNMNVNEVMANLASRRGVTVGPNDHVNMGQSSNDVIPTAIHLSAALEVTGRCVRRWCTCARPSMRGPPSSMAWSRPGVPT